MAYADVTKVIFRANLKQHEQNIYILYILSSRCNTLQVLSRHKSVQFLIYVSTYTEQYTLYIYICIVQLIGRVDILFVQCRFSMYVVILHCSLQSVIL